jgi:hypothetical protein
MILLSIKISGQDQEFYLFQDLLAAGLYLATVLKESSEAEYKMTDLKEQHINKYNCVRGGNVYGIDIQA